MHLSSYLRSAEEILTRYEGAIPFAVWLKDHFRQHKKFGSKDRKAITDLCFCYFRLGDAFKTLPVPEQLLVAQALCHTESTFVLALKPEWKDAASLEEKLALFGADEATDFFPLPGEVSDAIDYESFNLSHVIQPDLFLRLRPGRREDVLRKLSSAGVNFVEEDDCLRLPNNTKLDGIIDLDTDAVVQDKASQQTLRLLPTGFFGDRFTAWDCCAASGGKSLLLHDRFPGAQLTVSDVRESILHNLRSRFRRAGINAFQSFVADVSSPQFSLDKKFDLVLCDAPCSGSGTWGRTPEQLRFFSPEKILSYAALQKAIATNASRNVKKGGAFLYITCSVFVKENEEVVAHLQKQTALQLQAATYLKGYEEKADTLFAALFTL